MSPLLPSPRRTYLVTRTELLRTWRKLFSWSVRSVILVGLLPLVLLLYAAGLGFVGYFVGPALRNGDLSMTLPRAAVAGLVGMVTFFTAQRTIKQIGRIDRADGILTATPSRDVFAALVLAECCRALVVFAPPVVLFAVGLAVGTRSPLVALSVLVTLLVALLLAVALGYVVGLGIKNVAARSSYVASHRTAIGLVASFVIFGGYVVLTANTTAAGAGVGLLAALPVAWAADLALSPLGVGAPLYALGGAVTLVAGPILLLGVGTRLADWLWFGERARPDDDAVEYDPGETGRFERIVTPRLGRQTVRVAQKSWRRAARAPFTVQYAIVPFFMLFTPLQQTVQTGQVPAYLPSMLALSGAWATGAAFSLNPIGGEGAVLPVVLISDVEGRRFVGGLALAGLLVGIPLTVALVVVAGYFSGVATPLVVGWLATGVVACLVAPWIAAAAGVTFPKFDTTRVGMNREAIIPSAWAFLLYSVVLGVVVAPSLVAFHPIVLAGVAGLVGIPTTWLHAAGVGVTLLLGAILGPASFWLAVRRFEGYALE